MFLHSAKTNLDGPNSVLSSVQTNQKDFTEDHQSSEHYDSCGATAPWNYQSLWCSAFEREEESQCNVSQ